MLGNVALGVLLGNGNVEQSLLALYLCPRWGHLMRIANHADDADDDHDDD